MKISSMIKPPMPLPSVITRGPSSSRMRSDATTAPMAMPIATTPCSAEAWVTV